MEAIGESLWQSLNWLFHFPRATSSSLPPPLKQWTVGKVAIAPELG
ncbi:hypothetical protein NG799_17415 [Laspinema sp. D1]|uniref:Uncharacterized protein n=1 Tax=Laspinema palackyanum D2a TaxID=2953684 RepID=A0ABT2MTN1_9CYAN|nr:hypothetical protein [Laspinema sp. D2a]